MAIIQAIKKHKIIVVMVVALTMVLAFVALSYNQKRVQAQETIICDTEIPIGESMDTTYELLQELVDEHEKVFNAIAGFDNDEGEHVDGQLDIVKKIIEDIVSECSPRRCHGVCILEPTTGICIKPRCGGRPCPSGINQYYDQLKRLAYNEEEVMNEDEEPETVINGVIGSSANIIALIGRSDNPEEIPKGTDTVELPLRAWVKRHGEYSDICDCLLNDHKCRGVCRSDCEECFYRIEEYSRELDERVEIDENIKTPEEIEREEAGEELEGITLLEFIDRKLSVAREEFANCALTPLEILKFQQGEKMPKMTLPNHIVFEQKYHLPERVTECQEVCGEDSDTKECFDCVYRSLLNYYCCH